MTGLHPISVDVVAGFTSSGSPAFESVPASETGPGTFLVAGSPALAGGFAAGDEITVHADGTFDVVTRGGNLAVQLYAPSSFDTTDLAAVLTQVEGLGGYLDGGHEQVRVFTIPVTAGLAAVEKIFNAFIEKHPSFEWYFANVYDPADDVTPLNWWLE